MTKLCICKVCNCGRHRCPHKPQTTQGSGVCHLTEYANRYHPHPIDVRHSFKPMQEVQRNDAPVDDKTTHRVDYIRHPLEKPFVRVGEQYCPPAGEMEGLTSYNKDYVPKRAERAQMAAREFTRKEPGKFDGLPTYKSDYRPWDLKPRTLMNSTPAWTAPAGRFEGESAYTNDYVRYNAYPRESFKPNETAKRSDAALDDQTMYRKHYIPFELQKREPRAKEQWNPNKIPLDGLTTFRRDYTAKQVGPSESCKPDAKGFASDAPFIDDTTMRNDYKRWAVERPFHHEPDCYIAPKGAMDMNTTHNLNYTPKPLHRVVQKRPPSRQKISAAFNGDTNYRADFRPWELGQRQPYTAKDVYQAPKAAFEGIPTYKAHYIPHRLQPVDSYKPGITMTEPGAFDDNTMYRIEYVEKAVAPCPAIPLVRNPNYELVAGHRTFAVNEAPTMVDTVVKTSQAVC